MTRESPTEESIISASLSSIIRKSLSKHASTVKLYDEARPALKRIIRELKREKYKDKKSIDARIEQLQIWSFAILGYELLTALAGRIDANPFPGKRMTLAQIAFGLMPDVRSGVWMAIFGIFELCVSERHYFPVAVEELDVGEIEGKLRELLAGRDALPVKETKDVMPWVPQSKTYVAVKKELQRRGWLWRSLKRKGVVSKVIIPPIG